MIKWEKDPISGIKKEVSDQYAVAPHMPGATMIPSAAPGTFGGQLGQDPEEPFVQVIDPGEPGGGQVLDLRGRPRRKRTGQRTAAPDTRSVTDQLLAMGKGMSEQQFPTGQPQGQPQFPQAQWPTSQVPAFQGQPAVPMMPMPMGTPQMPPGMLAGMQGEPSAESVMPLPPPRRIAPVVPQPTPQAPQQQRALQPMEVQFHMADGSQYICYYHALVKEEGHNSVVLVTDLRANGFMQRFIPPVSLRGAPMGLVVPAHNMVLSVYSIGVQFRYGGQEFLVLVVAEGAPANGEDRPASPGGF